MFDYFLAMRFQNYLEKPRPVLEKEFLFHLISGSLQILQQKNKNSSQKEKKKKRKGKTTKIFVYTFFFNRAG